jgi:MYXO-CTERM domain-containing protein
MKHYLLVSAAVALLLIPRLGAASPNPTLNFVMPMGVDPFKLSYDFNGDFHIVTGNLLLPTTGGVEMLVPPSTPLLLNEFTVQSLDPSLSGPFDINTFAVAPPGFAPWNATQTSPDFFDIVTTPGSALEGQNWPGGKLFAGLEIDPGSVSTLPPGFLDARFKITGLGFTDAPEPSVSALALAPVVAGLLAMRRRRKRGSR